MAEDRIFLDFEPNDYIIRISPFTDNRGRWTGELHVGSCTTDDNTLNDDDYINLMQLTQMILAAIPAMENNDFVKEILAKYAKDSLEERKKKNAPKLKLENIDGNVINVDFKKEKP
tara:strand:- start:11422 stop:11769 length:348 start_codon:yes stop_codon:yes gene_type:complete